MPSKRLAQLLKPFEFKAKRASKKQFEDFLSLVPLELPADYLELLRSTNGGSCDLPNGFYVGLHSVDEILLYTSQYGFDQRGMLIIGTNGIGLALCAKKVKGKTMLGWADYLSQKFKPLGASLEEFLAALYALKPPKEKKTPKKSSPQAQAPEDAAQQAAPVAGELRHVARKNSAAVMRIAGDTLLMADVGVEVLRLSDLEPLASLPTDKQQTWCMAVGRGGNLIVTGHGDAAGIRCMDRAGNLLQTLTGHTAHVRAVALTADESTLLSASWDRTLRLWDLAAGRQLFQLAAAPDLLWFAAISPDGRLAASACRDGCVRVYDVATGRQKFEFQAYLQQVDTLEFSRDGQVLLTGGPAQAALWSMRTGTQILSPKSPGADVKCVFLHPTADAFIVAYGLEEPPRIYDFSGKVLHTFPFAPELRCAAVSPDGTLLATHHADALRIWPIPPLKAKAALPSPPDQGSDPNSLPLPAKLDAILTAKLSYRGKPVAMHTLEHVRANLAEYFFTREGLLLFAELTGESALAVDVRAVPPVFLEVKNTNPQQVTCWGASLEELVRSLAAGKAPPRPRPAPPPPAPSRTVVAPYAPRGGKGEIGEVFKFNSGVSRTLAMAISRDGRLALIADKPNATLWDLTTNKVIRTAAGGGLVWFAGADDHPYSIFNQLTDMATGTALAQLAREFGGSYEGIFGAISPDAARAVISDNGIARLFEIPAGRKLRDLPRQLNNGMPAAFSPDGSEFVLFSHEQGVFFCDAVSGRTIRTLPDSLRVHRALFTPAGDELITIDDSELALRDVQNLAVKKRVNLAVRSPRDVCLLEGGNFIVVSTLAGSLHLLKTATLKEIAQVEGKKQNANVICPHPDGRHVLAGGESNMVRLYRVR